MFATDVPASPTTENRIQSSAGETSLALLTRDVLQNNPPCQDAELNSALRNSLVYIK
jgi:hypothetical protein